MFVPVSQWVPDLPGQHSSVGCRTGINSGNWVRENYFKSASLHPFLL